MLAFCSTVMREQVAGHAGPLLLQSLWTHQNLIHQLKPLA